MPWFGVDFDKTLVDEDGQPIPEMVDRVKNALSEGKDVRIFTARISGDEVSDSIREINDFCLENFGQELPITNEKDYELEEIWDDKAVNPHMEDAKMMGMGNLAAAMREHVKGKSKKKYKLHRPDHEDKRYSPARRKRMKHYAR